ncbi:Fimbrial assembly protein [Verrucomicrobiia bacterium DG1235]|nr:Fimbrial assembly protein [Verrucomicrobiae bacterium DG1235]
MIKVKKKSASERTFNWRPNFRSYEDLPDMRAVRTQIFVPAVAICIAAVFAIYILFQEYRAMSIGESIVKLEEEISSYEARHDEKVKLNAEFMGIVRTMDEVIEFTSDNLVGSDFLLALSSRLVEGMYLTRVEYLENKATIEGSVQVPAEEASRLVNDYLKSIEEADSLQGLLTEYKLTSLERDGSGNNISFRIEVTRKEEEEKK